MKLKQTSILGSIGTSLARIFIKHLSGVPTEDLDSAEKIKLALTKSLE
jgi:hypothetical protein